MREWMRIPLAIAALWILGVMSKPDAEENPAGPETVLELKPVGFWPADEGEGTVLHDRSGNGNHGRLFNLAWEEESGLLDFNSGFQWAEIPSHALALSPAVSIGGWFFTRRDDYRGGTDVLGPDRTSTGAEHAQGVSLFNNAYSPMGSWVRWWGFNTLEEGVGLRLRSSGKPVQAVGTRFDVVHGSRADRLDTALEGVSMPRGRWQHVLYTFGDGTGCLYLDGERVQCREGLRYTPAARDFLIGNDMSWWLLFPNGSQSLDGSVRDLVIFDRALSADEVATLHRATRPSVRPRMRDDAFPRAPAALPHSRAPGLAGDASPLEIALGVLELDSADALDGEGVAALADRLEGLLEETGAHFPRVEAHERNSLIRVLLDTAGQEPRVRRLLGEALAKPLLEGVDLSRDALEGVRQSVGEDRWMDALDAYRALPPAKAGDVFFSQGDIHRDARQGHDLAYSPVVERGGIRYTVGSGQSWDAAERVGAAEYAEAVAALPEEFRQAALDWEHAGSPNLYRVRIHRTDAAGETESALLEGPWLVFEGSDTKLLGWTIDVDELGYIHLMGGMHNYPWPDRYLPGSWENMGVPREKSDERFPTVLYWVSKRPGDISAFEFVGHRNNPRNLAVPGLNYMNFVSDPGGVMFVYGRIPVQGIWSWGLYRYDAAARRWNTIGGEAADVWRDARAAAGEIFLRRGGTLWEPAPASAEERAFVWAWQPNHYNYIRGWGVRFDPSGRMHVRMPIRGLGANARILDHQVYVYSDDRGETFFRADGSPVKLPITVNPAPAHNADEHQNQSTDRLRLWMSLLPL